MQFGGPTCPGEIDSLTSNLVKDWQHCVPGIKAHAKSIPVLDRIVSKLALGFMTPRCVRGLLVLDKRVRPILTQSF